MEIYQGVALGVLQGLTEFLPVSSSGHLVLGQHLFGIMEPALSFDISLHVGTLAAVFLVFFREILAMIRALARFAGAGSGAGAMLREDMDLKLVLLILVGSVPTAVLGLVIKKYAMGAFASVGLVGVMLLLTGTFLWFTRRLPGGGVGVPGLSYSKAVWIGVVQGVAVLPGISRSGSTISAALLLGVDRETAGRFSFLLSLPAILGAEALSLRESMGTGLDLDPATLYGTLAAFVVGYFALIVLLRIVRQGRLYLFAPYCWTVGLIALGAGLI
ncbi:MAG: undecaprenyl-diphosphate phosphatase [Pseudomonadota bacterium]